VGSDSNLRAEETVASLDTAMDTVLEGQKSLLQRISSLESTYATSILSSPTEAQAPSSTQQEDFAFEPLASQFEAKLWKSWVYKRVNQDGQASAGFSIISSARNTTSSSILAGVSLSEISNLSLVNIPIYPREISNRQDYPNDLRMKDSGILLRASLVRLEEVDYGPVFSCPLNNLALPKTSVALETKLGEPDIVIVPTIVAMCGKLLKERGAHS
jgi:hypothetical protein